MRSPYKDFSVVLHLFGKLENTRLQEKPHSERKGEPTQLKHNNPSVPRWGAELDGETIPATLGQWLIDASVSFSKGCYTGQEVVARLHYKGKSKKRVLPAVSSGTLPDDCDTLLDTDSGKPVATIINRSNDSDNNSHLLLYMKPEIDIAAASCEAEPALHFSALPLPYTISAD